MPASAATTIEQLWAEVGGAAAGDDPDAVLRDHEEPVLIGEGQGGARDARCRRARR